MPKRQKVWVYRPPRPRKVQPSESIKAEVEARANELAETFLKPQSIKPPPEDMRFNYIVDIFTKWYRSYFYFYTRYHCPGSNAISPYFDTKFTRLEYVGNGHFNLSYMRHTGQWWEVYTGLSLDESLQTIKSEVIFQP